MLLFYVELHPTKMNYFYCLSPFRCPCENGGEYRFLRMLSDKKTPFRVSQ